MDISEMKIGIGANSIQTIGYGRWNDDTYKKLKEHGFSCTDFDMTNTNSVLYTESDEVVEELIKHEKELAKASGVEIWQVHGPWRWPALDTTEADRSERMEKMKKSIRFTAMLGCKYWVIHPIMPYGVNDVGTGNEEKTWEINLNFFRELLNTAKENNVIICLENMPMLDFSLSTPDSILKFVEEINDDNFRICLDTGHVSVFEELNVGDEVRKLGDKIKVFHIHDNKCCLDLHLMPCHGIIDWKDFSKALRDINFSGCFSLETLPSIKLPDDDFEMGCKYLYGIADSIIKNKII